MKNTITLLLCLSASFVFGQNYNQMLDHKSEWHLTNCFSGCTTDMYYTDGDTLHNGKNYKILNGYHFISRTFWLREDIQQKQVFLSIPDGNKREEHLLYDFSLNVGDSINIKNPISPFPDSPGYFTVDSIINRQIIDGSDRRFFYLSPSSTTSNIEYPVWIEGIGSLSLVNAPGGTPDVNDAGKISCYFNNGNLSYSQMDSIETCDPVYNSTNKEDIITNGVQVYPTHCNEDLYVSSTPEPIEGIEIINLNGAKVLEKSKLNNHFNTLDVSQLNAGIFIVKVFLPGEFRSFKIVKR